MTRFSLLYMLCLFVTMTVISCDKNYDDDVCTCPHGGTINSWKEYGDTTSVNREDTTEGFKVILEDWDEYETHDVSL